MWYFHRNTSTKECRSLQDISGHINIKSDRKTGRTYRTNFSGHINLAGKLAEFIELTFQGI